MAKMKFTKADLDFPFGANVAKKPRGKKGTKARKSDAWRAYVGAKRKR
jgi:hypothetical protein